MRVRPLLASIAASCILLDACGGHKSAGTEAQPASADPGYVNLFNWSDYMDPAVIAQFEKESGLKVRFTPFDASEMLETKLLTGHSDFDVAVPSASFLPELIKAGALRPFDFSQLPNRGNLDPELMQMLDAVDRGGRFAVPYHWVMTGIGLNVEKVRSALGHAPGDDWALLLDPQNAAALAKCGIAVVDSPSDVIASALMYRGFDPNSADPPQLQAAEQVLLGLRPYVRYIESGRQIEDLASGEICATFGWNGDLSQARSRAAEAGKPQPLAFVVPRAGAVALFDLLAMPVDAPHPENGQKFINFLLRADVAARNADFVHYATANLAAVPMIAADLRNDPSIYPPPEIRARLHILRGRTPELTREQTRIWSHFRAGNAGG